MREAAPNIEKEYCSPYGELMDSAADRLEQAEKVIDVLVECLVEIDRCDADRDFLTSAELLVLDKALASAKAWKEKCNGNA